MFVRGGVYKVVHEAHGRHAGQVLGLRADVRLRAHRPHQRRQRRAVPGRPDQRNRRVRAHARRARLPAVFRGGFAIVVTLYFWRKNIIGIHESSEKALRIMQITTVMVVILIVWCLATISQERLPAGAPADCRENLKFNPDALGWLKGTRRALDHRHRHPDRPGPFAARHERRREPGAGESRNRPSQAEEPGARRLRDLHLQHAVHLAGFVLRGDDHSGRARGRSSWTT